MNALRFIDQAALPAILAELLGEPSSLAWIIHDFASKKRKGALKD
jgi:hypothetical protein